MQRQRDAAGANLYALGDHRQRRAQDGGVRVEPAEVLEVPLRRPHRREPVGVGKAGALQQQAVLVVRRVRAVVGEKVEAELHRPGGTAPLPLIECFRILPGHCAIAGR